MERQERWARLMAEVQSLFGEELDGLTRQMMGGVDPAAILGGLWPALEGLLGGGTGAALSPSPYRMLGLDPSAPDEVVRLVYRHLARACHPDHGGSQEAMVRLNQAYEEIGRMRGWR